jgi:hypothetical protein
MDTPFGNDPTSNINPFYDLYSRGRSKVNTERYGAIRGYPSTHSCLRISLVSMTPVSIPSRSGACIRYMLNGV